MHWNQRHNRLDGMHRHHGPVDNGGDDLDGCRMMHNVAVMKERNKGLSGEPSPISRLRMNGLRVHRVGAMMDDGSVHHGGVRHHGGHGYHSGVGVSLGGGEGGEHEQLQWIKVRGLAGFDGNHRR